MKTFRRILSEVAQPKPADEINFKAKHAIEFFDYPSDVEDQFKSKKGKAPKRVADYDKGEDEAVYETMDAVGQEDDDIDNDGDSDKSDKYLLNRRKAIKKSMKKEEVEQIDEISKKTLDSYNNKASDSIRKNIWKSEGGSKLSDNEKLSDRKRSKGMDNADAKLGGYAKINAKESVEELDELSKKTLRSYGSKARHSLGTEKDRSKGINQASAKLYPNQYKNSPLKAKVAANEEVEQLDELSPNTLHSYIKKAASNLTGRAATAAIDGYTSKRDAAAKDNNRKVGKRISGITSASGRLADKANSVDEELELDESITKMSNARLKFHATKDFPHGRYTKAEIKDEHNRRMKTEPNYHTVKPDLNEVTRSGIKKSEQYTDVNGRTRTRLVSVKKVDRDQYGQDKIKEEVELDEISKGTLGRYVKAASTDRAAKTSEKDSVDRDYPNHPFADRLKYKKELGSKLNKRRVGISKAVDRLTREEVELDEAFAAGAEKLNDGSTVILKKQDADMLNNMFKDLNPANRKKMLKVAMTDKVGFNEILGFAREAL